ncbi:MAG: outer membrane homotrimeric porin [Solidesulfovibrio sp. DCME]|uniref:outer membrane homotrimeric porin n=1 Tax=Solidesulfovibrio sp. DCME TaxID=3447380 RepID=UPI003D143A31
MKRLMPLLLLCLLLACAATAQGATEVRMAGDFRAYGVFFENHNWTSWNATGSQTEETFETWQRWRLRTDFVANEAVKFRLGTRVNDTPWGYGTYTAANPAVAIEVYQAYLAFKWPGCDVDITAGLQPFSMPESPLFYDSPVFATKGGAGDGATNSFAGFVVRTPLVAGTLDTMFGFARLVDVNRTYDPTTTQVGDELDTYFLTLPITLNGFKFTPWGLAAVMGKASASAVTSIRNGMVSGGSFVGTGFVNNQNAYWWGGASATVTAADPLKFYADLMYGQGAANDRERNRRQGWFVDAGLEYTGLDWGTPQAGFWWSTGEDSSLNNGSQRIPSIQNYFGLGNTFLNSTGQELSKNNMNVNSIGAWGLTGSIKNISFLERLSHRLTFTATWGNNSPAGLRKAVAASGGNGKYLTMGNDLAIGESVLGANCDSKYMLYENLAFIVETGWAHYNNPNGSIWNSSTRRFTAMVHDAWMASFGFKYTF